MENLVWETRNAKTALEELNLNCPCFDERTATLEVVCQGLWTAWLFLADDPPITDQDKFTGAVRRQTLGGEQIWFCSHLAQAEARRWAEREFRDLSGRSEEYWQMHDLVPKLTWR
jgi:hypothetical protein